MKALQMIRNTVLFATILPLAIPLPGAAQGDGNRDGVRGDAFLRSAQTHRRRYTPRAAIGADGTRGLGRDGGITRTG